jgi:magnesium transporter
LNPTNEEKEFVESRANVRIPSIEALTEIESTSRLSVDHDVLYLSIPAVAQGDTEDAHLSPAGFILTKGVLITIRFTPLPFFDSVAEKVKQDDALRSATAVFTALLEAWLSWCGRS